MKITETKGNARNGIPGTRVRVWATAADRQDELIGEVIVNARYGVRYCREHPSGRYGRDFYRMVFAANERETEIQKDQEQRREWETNPDEKCSNPEFLLCDNCPEVMDCHSYARVASGVQFYER